MFWSRVLLVLCLFCAPAKAMGAVVKAKQVLYESTSESPVYGVSTEEVILRLRGAPRVPKLTVSEEGFVTATMSGARWAKRALTRLRLPVDSQCVRSVQHRALSGPTPSIELMVQFMPICEVRSTVHKQGGKKWALLLEFIEPVWELSSFEPTEVSVGLTTEMPLSVRALEGWEVQVVGVEVQPTPDGVEVGVARVVPGEAVQLPIAADSESLVGRELMAEMSISYRLFHQSSRNLFWNRRKRLQMPFQVVAAPYTVEDFLRFAALAIEEEDWDRALENLQTARGLAPEDTGVRFLEGQVHFHLRDLEMAHSVFESLWHQGLDYQYWLGRTDSYRGAFRAAVAKLEPLVAIGEEYQPPPHIWYLLGSSFGMLDEKQKAIEAYLKFLDLGAPGIGSETLEVVNKNIRILRRSLSRGAAFRDSPEQFSTFLQRVLGMDLGQARLRSPDGLTMPLTAGRRGTFLLHFWASWCPPCPPELKSLQQFLEKWRRQNGPTAPEVLAVSFDKEDSAALNMLKRNGIELPVFFDANGWLENEILKDYGLPVTLIVDQGGRVLDALPVANWQSTWVESRVTSHFK